MANNATAWPKMIRAVYSSFDTGRHQGDATARRVMDRVVSWLTAGLSLSPRLQARLIDNINMRTSFTVCDPGHPIRLSRNQLAYAARTNPEWFDLGLDGDDLPAEPAAENLLKGPEFSAAGGQMDPGFQQVFSSLSATIQQVFSSFSALFPQEAVVLAQHLVSMAAENSGSGATFCSGQNPKVMKREENESNHDGDMIFASQVLVHDRQEPEAAAHGLGQMHEPQADGLIEKHEPQADDVTRPDSSLTASHSQDELIEGHGEEPAARRPVLTVWVKPDARGRVNASGYLDEAGSKYAVRFRRFDTALDGIVGDDAWRSYMNTEIAPVVLPVERQATGIAGEATMSGLYAGADSWARKSPVFTDRAVMVEWEGSAPVAAYMLNGQNTTRVELRAESNNRYKGVI